ncbi:hypothetical protein Tco_0292388 [Tanacetum coccineum]
MIRPVPDEEIKASMFSIKDDKAASPDGFTSKFFKKARSIVGLDVCRAVQEFFRRGLDEFSMSSGLYPSLEKSTAFFSDMPIDIKEQISLALPFKEGSLPVRYLGVPMMSKKLRNEDCRVLIVES